MPSGCPSAIAPPFTFTRSGSSPSSRIADEALGGERLVQLDQVELVDADPRPLQQLATAGTGPMPITRGSTPTTALADERRQRLGAQLARPLLARDHERCRAVV